MGVINQLKEKIMRYLDVHVKLVKINFIWRTSILMSYFMFALISLFIVFCIVLFTGFGLTEAFMLAGISKMAAFFLTIGVYFVLLLVVIMLRKSITRFFASTFIKVLTEGDDDDPEEKDEE